MVSAVKNMVWGSSKMPIFIPSTLSRVLMYFILRSLLGNYMCIDVAELCLIVETGSEDVLYTTGS